MGSEEGAAVGAAVGKYVGAPTNTMLLVDTITDDVLVMTPEETRILATAEVTAVVNDESRRTVLDVVAVIP